LQRSIFVATQRLRCNAAQHVATQCKQQPTAITLIAPANLNAVFVAGVFKNEKSSSHGIVDTTST
jgi:hypothetical protein